MLDTPIRCTLWTDPVVEKDGRHLELVPTWARRIRLLHPPQRSHHALTSLEAPAVRPVDIIAVVKVVGFGKVAREVASARLEQRTDTRSSLPIRTQPVQISRPPSCSSNNRSPFPRWLNVQAEVEDGC